MGKHELGESAMRYLLLIIMLALNCTPVVRRVAVTRSRDSIDRPMRVVVVTKDALVMQDTVCVWQRWEQKDGRVRLHRCDGQFETVDAARVVGPCECKHIKTGGR